MHQWNNKFHKGYWYEEKFKKCSTSLCLYHLHNEMEMDSTTLLFLTVFTKMMSKMNFKSIVDDKGSTFLTWYLNFSKCIYCSYWARPNRRSFNTWCGLCVLRNHNMRNLKYLLLLCWIERFWNANKLPLPWWITRSSNVVIFTLQDMKTSSSPSYGVWNGWSNMVVKTILFFTLFFKNQGEWPWLHLCQASC